MILTIFLLLGASLVLSVPLTENNSLRSGNAVGGRIIGGQVANAGQFPFLAAINYQTNVGSYFCGGALLTNQWVLTAGHCVDGAVLFIVQLGSHNLNSNDPNLLRLSTDLYVLHPEYDPATLANDIGLIQFRMPITFTTYIKPVDLLPSVILSDNSPLVAMGWGQISDFDEGLQSEVNYVSVTTIPNTACQLTYGNQILRTMVCAEGNYNEGTCYGDTGGPLIQYVNRRQVMHVGVASFISQNGCESTDPSGYTRTFSYVSWIKNLTSFH